MEALINRKPSARLLRIDIRRWGSPVANQYGIRRLPTVWLYEGTTLATRDAGEAMDLVNRLD